MTCNVTGATAFAGLLGFPIKHSLSPGIHNRWFDHFKIDAVYMAWEVPHQTSFAALVTGLMGCSGFLGANITIPYKEAIGTIEGITRTFQAENVGAANTLFKDAEGNWLLDNTDIYGIKESIRVLVTPTAANAQVPRVLQSNCNSSVTLPSRTHVLLLGSGGAAKAALWVLENLLEGECDLTVAARSPYKIRGSGNALPRPTKTSFVGFDQGSEVWSEDCARRCCGPEVETVVVISSLPPPQAVGDRDYAQEIISQVNHLLVQPGREVTKRRLCYFDMSYQQTPALECAAATGWKVLDGKLMLTTQAAHSFYCWTKQWPL